MEKYFKGGGGSGVDETVMKGILEKKIATIFFQQMVRSFEHKIYFKVRYICILRTILLQF